MGLAVLKHAYSAPALTHPSSPPWTQDVNWAYIIHSEDALCMFNLRPVSAGAGVLSLFYNFNETTSPDQTHIFSPRSKFLKAWPNSDNGSSFSAFFWIIITSTKLRTENSQKQPPEVFHEIMYFVLKISQNYQENKFSRVLILKKLQASAQVPVNFETFLRTSILQDTFSGYFWTALIWNYQLFVCSSSSLQGAGETKGLLEQLKKYVNSIFSYHVITSDH